MVRMKYKCGDDCGIRCGQQSLQVFVILWEGGLLGLLDVLLDLCLPGGVHSDLWGHQGGHGHELQVGVTDQLPKLQDS